MIHGDGRCERVCVRSCCPFVLYSYSIIFLIEWQSKVIFLNGFDGLRLRCSHNRGQIVNKPSNLPILHKLNYKLVTLLEVCLRYCYCIDTLVRASIKTQILSTVFDLFFKNHLEKSMSNIKYRKFGFLFLIRNYPSSIFHF